MPIIDFVKVRNLGAPVNETKVIINLSSENNGLIKSESKLSAHTNNRRRKNSQKQCVQTVNFLRRYATISAIAASRKRRWIVDV